MQVRRLTPLEQETMPTDACQFYYECRNCNTLLRLNPSDRCVFCSFGSSKCPDSGAARVLRVGANFLQHHRL